jgi:hypothetical protein
MVDAEGTADRGIVGCGREGAWDAAHSRAAESAEADFVTFQPRFQPPRDDAGWSGCCRSAVA